MASKINIQNVKHLEKMLHYINKSNIVLLRQIIDSFPFHQLQTDVNEENMSYILRILTEFVACDRFISFKDDIEHCFEFVLENWKRYENFKDGENDSILENILDYFIQLLSTVQSVYIHLNLNIDTQRVCLQIHDTFKEKTLRKHCIKILTQLFSINGLYFAPNEIYDTCINEIYEHSSGFEFILELSQLGSAILTAINVYPVNNRFAFWILKICPGYLPFLHFLSDKITTFEFLNCLSKLYTVKEENNHDLTNVYVKHINRFKSFLHKEEFKEVVVIILNNMLKDLYSQGILPNIDDLIIHDKDFVIISIYLDDIFTKKGNSFYKTTQLKDAQEIFKLISRMCYSSNIIRPATLKAMCYLYPKYIKQIAKSNKTENMILNSLSTSPDFEQILSNDSQQLFWILTSEQASLKLHTIRYWLKYYQNNDELLNVLQATENVTLLTHFILEEYINRDISKRVAELLRLADDQNVAESLMIKIPTAIKDPACLADLFSAKPAVPKNIKLATFFCKIMSTIISLVYKTEVFVGVCYYSMKLMSRTRRCSEAIQYFINKDTLSTLTEACTNENYDVFSASTDVLELLLKIQCLLGITTEQPLELDFRKIIRYSGNRTRKALRVLEEILKNKSDKLLKLPENDILIQYLYIQELPPENMKNIFRIMTLFLKKYNHLIYSSVNVTFVQLNLLNLMCGGPIEEFMEFLEIILINIDKKYKTPYEKKDIKKIILRYRPDLIFYFNTFSFL